MMVRMSGVLVVMVVQLVVVRWRRLQVRMVVLLVLLLVPESRKLKLVLY